MAKIRANRRAVPAKARGSVAPPPPSRRSAPPPAAGRRTAPPPARTASRPAAPAAAAPGRKFRGAAPWAARHAAKHAAEAALRNQEPPRPGSARATLRTPEQAESIKARVTELHHALGRLRALKKQLPDRFLEAGAVLRKIRDEKLFDAKGYASFDAFVEREIDLGSKTLVLRITRIPEVFSEEAIRAHGLEALLAALEALDQAAQRAAQRAVVRPPLPGQKR